MYASIGEDGPLQLVEMSFVQAFVQARSFLNATSFHFDFSGGTGASTGLTLGGLGAATTTAAKPGGLTLGGLGGTTTSSTGLTLTGMSTQPSFFPV